MSTDAGITSHNLREYTIAIEWSAPGRTHKETIIARSVGDAKEIAVRIFRKSRADNVVIESVEQDSPP